MKNLFKTALITAGLLVGNTAFAGTAAGVDITNTAVATYDGGTVSASAVVQVQEVIDVALSTSSPQRSVTAGDTNQTLPFTVQNTGNGTETFKVSYVNSGDISSENISIFVDLNNNGVIDTNEVSISGDTITLDRDETVGLIIKADIPASASADDLSIFALTVSSITEASGVVAGTAAPGTLLAGQGTGTADAVVGENASQTRNAQFRIGVRVDPVTITKTVASSLDPFGGNTNIPGTQVTYNIRVVVDTSSGPVNNLIITDEIPADMTYTPNSLSLNNSGQTDADDAADNSKVSANLVTVELGNIVSSSTFTIQLTAEIK
ncbi:isopeptide-forming domain-containing fimbrial protein [Bacterioplanoides sp.]|uniref:isopeptide-forming domain-containing fimbrial protein n=1 Tax=Bacterioplanoides sp. TaxID=2066072 RepID=UPI003AFFA262